MPKIIGVAIANPTNMITQDRVKEFSQTLFENKKHFSHLLPVYENANVQTRYFTTPLEWFNETHSFTDVNDLYIQTALDLSEKATSELAKKCGIRTQDFDVVFFISTTGLSTPSIDARLLNRIPMSPHIKRIPIWGLGCAGGAGGIARAYDYLKAYPTHRALIIAVELCSLAFQKNDLSSTNVISTAIFGDGAAACALYGDDVPLPTDGRATPSVLGSLSTIYPDTLDLMSWRVTSEGFKVQLSREIPSIVTSLVKGNIEEFLRGNEIPLDRVSHYIFHPGGMKAYAEGMGVPLETFTHSINALRNFGNMSSVTIYFILKYFLENTKDHSGEYGLMGALGPGFSSELVLLQWK